MKKEKTIFITITKGLIARNILRTQVFKKLAARPDLKLVILLTQATNASLPSYFLEELNTPNVIIEILPPKKTVGAERLFNRFISNLAFSKSMRIYLKFHTKKEKRVNFFVYPLYFLFFAFLSRFDFIKKASRFVDLKFFISDQYGKYFEKYQPDLVFSTCIMSQFDIEILKEAKKRGIRTISMPRSWDNLDKLFFRIEPDKFIVQNEIMKKETAKYQLIDKNKIAVVGFPQFDMYLDKNVIKSKEDFCRDKGLNPDWPILFLGGEGIWSPNIEKVFENIILAREEGRLPPCNIIIRPHFSDRQRDKFYYLKNFPGVFIDENYRRSDFFTDFWDPRESDMAEFTNLLFHCDLLVNYASTLALDVACFDKPIICLNYGIRIIKGRDLTNVAYQTCHYKWVLETGAVSLAANQEELYHQINYYLEYPETKRKERRQLVENLCYKLDGYSADRLTREVLISLDLIQ